MLNFPPPRKYLRRTTRPLLFGYNAGEVSDTTLHVAVDESGNLVLETREQGLRRARAMVRKYIPAGRVLSDELIQERRHAAALEERR